MGEIIHHKNQKDIFEFLKEENKNCLNCYENENNTCVSITCDWYNIPIIDIDEIKCIHQKKNKKR